MRSCTALAVLLAVLLGTGCEKRDRSNPFDPGNPDTGGVPPLLNALAGNQRIDLTWSGVNLDDVLLLRIERRDPSEQIVDLVPDGLEPVEEQFEDLTVENDLEYDYRLTLELASGNRVATDWDAAKPGDAVPWVIDSEGGGLSRLTPDARDRLLQVRSGSWFLDLAIDTIDLSVWSVDYLEGTLYQHRFDGEEVRRIRLPGARAVDVDLDGASIWVGSFDRQTVERVTRDGATAWSDTEAGSIEEILAVEPTGIWLSNREGEIRIYREDALVKRISSLNWPVAMAASLDGDVLVLERQSGEVRRFSSEGTYEATSSGELTDPVDLCSDGDGGAWVADPGRGGIVHLDVRLFEQDYVPFPGALGVTWDVSDSLLWVVGDRRVEIRDADGRFLSGMTVGVRPVKVELFHGTVLR